MNKQFFKKKENGFESAYNGFESVDEPRKWIQICLTGFESVHEQDDFPENGFESPKRDSNLKKYF